MALPQYAKELEVRLLKPEEQEKARRVGTRAFNINALDWYPPEKTLVGVTPEGTIVWEFVHPDIDPDRGARRSIYRMTRLFPE